MSRGKSPSDPGNNYALQRTCWVERPGGTCVLAVWSGCWVGMIVVTSREVVLHWRGALAHKAGLANEANRRARRFPTLQPRTHRGEDTSFHRQCFSQVKSHLGFIVEGLSILTKKPERILGFKCWITRWNQSCRDVGACLPYPGTCFAP